MINLLFHTKYSDIIQVLLAGGSGFGFISLANVDLIIKVIIGIVTLSFIIWKWRCAWVDRVKKQKKDNEKI